MKHVTAVTRPVARAASAVTPGSILMAVSQILTVIATFWVEKEAANEIIDA
ncbi:MAG TPA: hypothetical protein P5069_02410 [Candidatus Hydrogenedentes bacterium]|nr:hypothetical protein [Candidatus Hydrogenedentota bacterium]HOH49352.1 hypothetical protein [Candidatus Hydrogenedentota bacterium]HQL93087.1 hypothetical protein [Candidatus Hydrogenedentota bacterium]HRZ81278.1 hypothetical protein [Candidatus Hydrogenedentota bacterium]